jgi:large-conductance mechanosensitive channel
MESTKNDGALLNQLKTFIADNNIVGTCAGVIIALVTKDLILSFVGDIVIPFFVFVFLKLHIKWLTNILPAGKLFFDFTNFIKQFITWLLTLIVTFFVIKVTFQMLLGINFDKKDDTETENKRENNKEGFYS